MKKILITGSAGSLGLALTEHLAQTDRFNVYTMGRHEVQIAKHLVCDVNDHKKMGVILQQERLDVVVHSAAIFSGNFSELLATNFLSAKNILDSVLQYKLETRVVLIGSAAEYGAVSAQDNPLDEECVLAPISDYGLSKACQSQLTSLYARRGVDVVNTRIFNLYGDGVSSRLFAGRVQEQIREIKAGRKSSIEVGNLDAIRDYISTKEAAHLITAAIEYGLAGETYHIASGQPISMRQQLAQLLSAAKLDWSVVNEQSKESNHTGFDVPFIYSNNAKIARLLSNSRDSAH